MRTRAKAVVLAVALFGAAAVLTVSMVFTCWDRSPCARGTVLIALAEFAMLGAVVCLAVAVTGSVSWLRRRAAVSALTVAALLVLGGNAWTWWQDSGRERREVSGWLTGFRHGWVCYVDDEPDAHCLEGYVPGLQDIQPGDPFRGTVGRERRTGPWRLYLDRAGPDVRPLVDRPSRPIPDAAVVRRQAVWTSWAGVRPTDQPPPHVAYVVEWTELSGPPLGAAFHVIDPLPGLDLDVTLTCPDDDRVTLWVGGAPATGVQAIEEAPGWARLRATIPAADVGSPFHCGPED